MEKEVREYRQSQWAISVPYYDAFTVDFGAPVTRGRCIYCGERNTALLRNRQGDITCIHCVSSVPPLTRCTACGCKNKRLLRLTPTGVFCERCYLTQKKCSIEGCMEPCITNPRHRNRFVSSLCRDHWQDEFGDDNEGLILLRSLSERHPPRAHIVAKIDDVDPIIVRHACSPDPRTGIVVHRFAPGEYRCTCGLRTIPRPQLPKFGTLQWV